MVFRIISRVSTVSKFYVSTAVSHCVKQNISASSKRVSFVPSACVPRYFSQKLQPAYAEMLVVDFDYVKRASTQNDVMIIDVREPVEIKQLGKIPNSINIPIGFVESTLDMSEEEFREAFKRDKPKPNDEIIFYCKIGRRSGMAQRCATYMGFKNTKNYLGSFTEWAVKNQ